MCAVSRRKDTKDCWVLLSTDQVRQAVLEYVAGKKLVPDGEYVKASMNFEFDLDKQQIVVVVDLVGEHICEDEQS